RDRGSWSTGGGPVARQSAHGAFARADQDVIGHSHSAQTVPTLIDTEDCQRRTQHATLTARPASLRSDLSEFPETVSGFLRNPCRFHRNTHPRPSPEKTTPETDRRP